MPREQRKKLDEEQQRYLRARNDAFYFGPEKKPNKEKNRDARQASRHDAEVDLGLMYSDMLGE